MRSLFIILGLTLFGLVGCEEENDVEQLEISGKHLVLDGGDIQKTTCPHKEQVLPFKNITIGNVDFVIKCLDDYLGGFYISRELIAQRDGDAGDSWDTQSYIFKGQTEDDIYLSRVMYYTSDLTLEFKDVSEKDLKGRGWSDKKLALLKSGKLFCEMTFKNFKWDTQLNKFVEFKDKLPSFNRKLKPAAHYLKNCK